MRVIITSSRDWTGELAKAKVWSVLSSLARVAREFNEPLTVVHGACPTGGDLYASEFCQIRWTGAQIIEDPYPADWDRWGKSAGPARNQNMADKGADLCVGFIRETTEKPISKGTRDMLRRAGDEYIPVKIIEWKDEYGI